jgi:hypothetical protein
MRKVLEREYYGKWAAEQSQKNANCRSLTRKRDSG